MLREFAAVDRYDVKWVLETPLTENRTSMGWPEVSADMVEMIESPDENRIKELVSARTGATLHVMGGVLGVRMMRKAFLSAPRGSRIIFLNEPPVPQEMDVVGKTNLNRRFGKVLPLAHRLMRLFYFRKVVAVLGIGQGGVEAYSSFGWGTKVFPYGYFPEGPGADFVVKEPVGAFKIVYLGGFGHRKGSDLLIDAMGHLKAGDWHLEMIGDGESRSELEQRTGELGIEEKVDYLGFKPWAEAMDRIAAADLVVVPSRHDGWGAVVGEALMRGVPVVATDRTGSSLLLDNALRGRVVKAGSVSDLARGIGEVIESGRLSVEDRRKIWEWAKCLEPAVAAQFFADIVKWVDGGERPVAPWERNMTVP